MAAPKLRFLGFEEKWSEKKIGELAEIVRGASPRPIQDAKWFDNESEIGWLRISDVTKQNGRIHYLEQKISKLGQEKTRVLIEPHLLLSIAATVGKPVINYIKTGVHDGFLIFLNPLFNQEFMFQWLEMFRPHWKKFGQPGSQLNLNSELVRNQEILIPNIAEQEKIASFFETIDKKIQLQQEKIDLLKQQKKGLMQKIFSQELRFKDENGQDFAEWENKKLEDISEVRDGTHDSPKYQPTGYPLITSKNLNKNGTLNFDDVNFISQFDFEAINKRSKVDKNDILFGMIGTIGNPVKVQECDFAIKNVALIKDKNQLNNYLIHFLRSSFINKQFYFSLAGGTQKFIGLSLIRQLNILLPCKEERIKITELFNRYDLKLKIESHKLQSLIHQKQAFMQQMFI